MWVDITSDIGYTTRPEVDIGQIGGAYANGTRVLSSREGSVWCGNWGAAD